MQLRATGSKSPGGIVGPSFPQDISPTMPTTLSDTPETHSHLVPLGCSHLQVVATSTVTSMRPSMCTMRTTQQTASGIWGACLPGEDGLSHHWHVLIVPSPRPRRHHSRQQAASVSDLVEVMVLVVGSFAISYGTMGQMKR
jgi:hypothetical protein